MSTPSTPAAVPPAIADARYVSLVTFRKDGSGVPTPLWAAESEGRLLIWTNRDSWKVKRIRRNPHVRLAPCSVRGQITGSWVDGYAEVMTPDQSAIAVRALHRKYGIQSRVTTFFSKLRRGADGTICIAITPEKLTS